jgi:hypothetical protein
MHAQTALWSRGVLLGCLGTLCTLWAALTAAKLLVRRCPMLEPSRALVTLPCVLLFGAFAMLGLY